VMSRGDRNVKRIHGGLRRQSSTSNQLACQLRGLLRKRENRKPSEPAEPTCSLGGIATGRLVEYCLRNDHSVLTSAAPPSPRELLVGGNDDVLARPRSQVTDDTRFDIDAGSHGFRTSGSA
jgi:hypothetical protein